MRRRSLVIAALVAVSGLSAGPSATAVMGAGAAPDPVVLFGNAYPDMGFGLEVAVDGDTAITTASCNYSVEGPCPSVYVFVRSEVGWRQQAQLVVAPDPGYPEASLMGDDQEGRNGVALSGDTIAIGVESHTASGDEESDSVRIYQRSGSTWTQQARLADPDPGAPDAFGYHLSLDGDTLAVGGLRGTTIEPSNYVTYVFARNGTQWSQQAALRPDPDATYGNGTFALDGDTLLVAGEDLRREDVGAVLVYARTGATWTLTGQLTAHDDDRHGFGQAVAFDGETAAVTARGRRMRDADWVYVFARAGDAWERQARLEEPRPGEYSRYGHSLDVSGDTVAVSAEYSWVPDGDGAAYVYTRRDGSWKKLARLTAPEFGGRLGTNVAVDGKTLVVGTFPFNQRVGGEIRIFEGTAPTA